MTDLNNYTCEYRTRFRRGEIEIIAQDSDEASKKLNEKLSNMVFTEDEILYAERSGTKLYNYTIKQN